MTNGDSSPGVELQEIDVGPRARDERALLIEEKHHGGQPVDRAPATGLRTSPVTARRVPSRSWRSDTSSSGDSSLLVAVTAPGAEPVAKHGPVAAGQNAVQTGRSRQRPRLRCRPPSVGADTAPPRNPSLMAGQRSPFDRRRLGRDLMRIRARRASSRLEHRNERRDAGGPRAPDGAVLEARCATRSRRAARSELLERRRVRRLLGRAIRSPRRRLRRAPRREPRLQPAGCARRATPPRLMTSATTSRDDA